MGAAVGLKTCVLHSAVLDQQVKPHPDLLPGAARLARERYATPASHQALPFPSLERHIEDAGHPRRTLAIEVGAPDGGEARPQPLTQSSEPRLLAGQLSGGDLAGDSEAHDLMCGQRARS